MRFSKILILKKRIKIELAILCCIVLLLLLLSSYFLFLFLNLRIGEIVLKKDDVGVRIGRVEGISVLKFKYLIRWEDRTISEEFSYNLARKAFEENGRKIFDATINGKLTVFKKVNFYDLFK